MFSISLNMKFWDDGQPNSTRIRNVNFSWNRLKKLRDYLKTKGINTECFLYDFSPNQIIADSIHIPYPLGVYKKSEKTNIILKKNSNFDFFMMIDCDAFFDNNDYYRLECLIKKLNTGDIITFDLAKLSGNVEEYLINEEFDKKRADWSFAYSGDKSLGPLYHHMGGLGGVYIADTNLLLECGGFNENYETWGGEDGEMIGKIMYSQKKHRIIPNREFFPYHLPHFSDWGNQNYYNVRS